MLPTESVPYKDISNPKSVAQGFTSGYDFCMTSSDPSRLTALVSTRKIYLSLIENRKVQIRSHDNGVEEDKNALNESGLFDYIRLKLRIWDAPENRFKLVKELKEFEKELSEIQSEIELYGGLELGEKLYEKQKEAEKKTEEAERVAKAKAAEIAKIAKVGDVRLMPVDFGANAGSK
jgi:hypothetical protein